MRQSPLQISVIICTRNRAPSLRRALQSLVECEKPDNPEDWEVIIVDNGSSDDTPSLAEMFGATLPLRYVREEQVGLSNARNRGVQEAHGTWILWIDDDVTVESGWLRAYADAIRRHTDAIVLGGSIIVRFEGDPPKWLSTGVRWVQDAYASRPPDRFRGQFFSRGAKPYGANFGLRRAAAQTVPFDTTLGRHPLRPTLGGEETEVIRSVLTGGTGWWVPEASVLHHIDRARQTTDYLWAYFSASGRLSARAWSGLSHGNRWWCFFNAVRLATTNHCAHVVLRLLRHEKYRARTLREAAWNWGYVMGCVDSLKGTQEEPVLV